MGIYLELSEVNSNLSGVLGPLVLGSAAAGYIAAAVGGAAAQGGGLLGFISAHATATALTGVAAAIVAILGLFMGGNGSPEKAPVTATPQLATPPGHQWGCQIEPNPAARDGRIDAGPARHVSSGPSSGTDGACPSAG
jgi:hypothetical protein